MRKYNGSAGRNIYIQPLMPSDGGWRYHVGPTLAGHELSDVVPTLANHREYCQRWYNIYLPMLVQRWQTNVGTMLKYCLRHADVVQRWPNVSLHASVRHYETGTSQAHLQGRYAASRH